MNATQIAHFGLTNGTRTNCITNQIQSDRIDEYFKQTCFTSLDTSLDAKVPEGCAENEIIQDAVDYYIENWSAEDTILYLQISKSNIVGMYEEMSKNITIAIKNHLDANTKKNC